MPLSKKKSRSPSIPITIASDWEQLWILIRNLSLSKPLRTLLAIFGLFGALIAAGWYCRGWHDRTRALIEDYGKQWTNYTQLCESNCARLSVENTVLATNNVLLNKSMLDEAAIRVTLKTRNDQLEKDVAQLRDDRASDKENMEEQIKRVEQLSNASRKLLEVMRQESLKLSQIATNLANRKTRLWDIINPLPHGLMNAVSDSPREIADVRAASADLQKVAESFRIELDRNRDATRAP